MESRPNTPYLLISRSGGDRNVPLLGGNTWKLGRGSQSSIILEDDLVSRTHAMIQQMDLREFVLIDMGSRNGSFVNERRVSTPVALRDGDRLTLGNAQMVFYNPLETNETSAAQPDDDLATVCQFMQCQVSVLVIDIRGFSVLAQNIDDAMLCQITGSWFGEADRVMRGHGSAVQKYIGDAVMAVWLHRAAGQEHVEILEILRALAEFIDVTASLGPRFGLPAALRVGAGLNTGKAIVGNTGTNQVSDYTAMGECVNAAFRLETATKGLQTDLCLGKTTSDFLRFWPRAAAYLQETDVKLKGYEAPVVTCPASFDRLKSFLNSVDSPDTMVT
jgi:Adenylate cyclase, family 3 (some proteins contain HAMP domain)